MVEVIEFSGTTSGNYLRSGDVGGTKYACGQTFTVGTTGDNIKWDVTSVRVRLDNDSDMPGTNLYRIYICHVDAFGTPLVGATGGEYIGATATFRADSISSTEAVYTKALSCTLEPNTKYGLVLRPYSGAWGDDDYIKMDWTSTATYAGGNAYEGGQPMGGRVGDCYFYIYGEPAPADVRINIGDVWKNMSAIKINIGNVWKDVVNVQQNIGNVWKAVYES